MKKREKKKEGKAIDLIMWVGRRYYTIKSFVEEAKRLGCCKRIPPGFPKHLVMGKSRVYLVHDTTEEGKPRKRRKPRVFAYYVVRGVEAVRRKGFPSKELEKMGVRPVDRRTVLRRPSRGCGFQVPGGLYLVSAEDMDKVPDRVKKGDLGETVKRIVPPVETSLKRYRGFRYVLGDRIGIAPEEEWFKAGEIQRGER